MKNLLYLALITIAAIGFSACQPPPANNANAGNTNTNTAVSTAAPTAASLLELDKQANEAFFKGDSKFFETFLSDKFVGYHDGQRSGKAEAIAEIANVKCDVKRDWKLEDPQMAKIARVQGKVTIQVLIDETGNVVSAKAMSGPPLLIVESQRAAMQARFSPTMINGQAVKVSGVITYNFILP